MIQEAKKRIWSEYQKDVADDHFFYVRSCIRQSFFPGSEQFFLKLMREVLGKDVYEDPAHTTCTGIGYHGDIVPSATIMTVIARHFALMKEHGYKDLAISCVTSFGLYTEILETWKHFPDQLEKTREYLFKATGREFDIPESLAHASDIIYKFRHQIAEKAKHRLVNKKTGEPLRIVEHIGCHYAKMFPKSGIGGAEFPNVLSGLVDAWGGEIIDYPERRHCCGFGFRQYLVQANRGYSVSNSEKKFSSMKPYKPDMILTNCPGCNMFMDRWQYTIKELEGTSYGQNGESIPVLTYEELAGLVLGFNPWDLGLQYHMVQAEPLLKKLGVEFDSSDKFKTKDGRQMPVPENLINV
ncbi:MAG TPA: heterodisulfide reductase-related iron-sulfur binding cluster [Bacteroidales bacterium]|nr:heterodisulfide reductase-related iron-sulfur binding cluster [Bacteroidales bacterium]